MPSLLQTLFEKLTAPQDDPSAGEIDLQLATAALLVEMIRADSSIGAAEQHAAHAALREEFALDEAALAELIAQAEAEARDAPGYFAFTSRINQGFSPTQKVRVMEYLWRVALADGHLCAHENHLMRKLADLIHVGHGDYIAAKERARAYLAARRTPP